MNNFFVAAKTNRRKIEFNVFVIISSVFILIAVMQSSELSGMLAETRSIGMEIGIMDSKQEILLERYFS